MLIQLVKDNQIDFYHSFVLACVVEGSKEHAKRPEIFKSEVQKVVSEEYNSPENEELDVDQDTREISNIM
jgi:hypothetical protein